MINYALIRSKRKTIAIHITKDAAVEVRAPLKVSKAEIDRFVESKEKWIYKHLATVAAQVGSKTEFTLSYGERVTYRGKGYPIVARQGNRVGFDDYSFYMPENLNAEQIKHSVIQIYNMLAVRDLTNKVIEFARLMNVTPIAVKINSAKTRWGSCSGKNSINFSWRLILADDAVIDYVVVHELAHIKEHNHSARFWAVVEEFMPDYSERRQGLKSLQKKMASENWE